MCCGVDDPCCGFFGRAGVALVVAEEEDVMVVFFVDDCVVVAVAGFGSRVPVVVARPGVEVFVWTVCVW